jgi:hypothetical protein
MEPMETGGERSRWPGPWAGVVLAAVLACGGQVARAQGGEGAAGAHASIDFRVVIPVVLRVEPVTQQPRISISATDVERGYADVERATLVRVTSNNPSGFGVSLRYDPALVARVEAHIDGQGVSFGGRGGSAHLDAPRMSAAPLVVDYRIFLAPGARAGDYPWPVALAFVPAP